MHSRCNVSTLLQLSCLWLLTAFMRACNAFAGRWMASKVTLKCGDLTETIPPFEGRLHIPTIKDAFTVRVARINNALAPVDSQGFTHATFKPGDTLDISDSSAEAAAVPGTPHSRGLFQWHLIPWYNMICTMNIPGTVHSALVHSTSVFRCLICFLGYCCGVFLLVAHRKIPTSTIIQVLFCQLSDA